MLVFFFLLFFKLLCKLLLQNKRGKIKSNTIWVSSSNSIRTVYARSFKRIKHTNWLMEHSFSFSFFLSAVYFQNMYSFMKEKKKKKSVEERRLYVLLCSHTSSWIEECFGIKKKNWKERRKKNCAFL